MNEPKLRSLLAEVGITQVQKARNEWLVISCPFAEHLHEHGTDRNPSFCIKIAPSGFSGFNCFTCHQKGNLHQFFTKLGTLRGEDYSKIAVRAALEETPDQFDEWDRVRKETEPLIQLDKKVYFRIYPSVFEHEEALEYLASRNISAETASILELRYDPDEKRVLFPVYDNASKLYGFSGRAIGKSKIKVRDYLGLRKERLLLGEQFVESGKPIILVEGLFALASLYENRVDEFATPVASMGSRLTYAQAEILMDHGNPVYILYDNDIAGRQGAYGTYDKHAKKFMGGGALDMLKNHVPVFVLDYPKGINDPDFLTGSHVRAMIQRTLQ